jgi:hypothetical protein
MTSSSRLWLWLLLFQYSVLFAASTTNSTTYTITSTAATSTSTSGTAAAMPVYGCGDYFTGELAQANDINWYEFDAPSYLASVYFNSCGSQLGFDTYLYLNDSAMNTIAECDDCGDCGTQTQLTYNNLPSGVYYLGIGGYQSHIGQYVMNITCNGTVGPTTTQWGPPPPATTPTNSIIATVGCGDVFTGTTTQFASAYAYYDFVIQSPAQSVPVLFDSCGSNYDTFLGISDENGNLRDWCNDCGDCGASAQLPVYGLQPDIPYRLQIGGNADATGVYMMNIRCNVTNAVPLTAGATVGCGDIFVGATNHSNDIDWYDFINIGDVALASVMFDSCGSQFDTYLYVNDYFTGDEITQCDDCGECGVKTQLTMNNLQNGRYSLGIGGFGGQFGPYVMNIVCIGASSNATANQHRTNRDPYLRQCRV